MSKLQRAMDRCDRAAALSGGAVLVALSGGKDSLVTLELCASRFSHVEAFYMYHVQGLACAERSVDSAARRAGVRVHKVPHPELSTLIKHSVLRPHSDEAAKVVRIKQADVERMLTAKTGITWFAYGERASDSFARRLYTRKDDGVRADWRRVYPIWDWLHAEVISYLKQKHIALPERFGASDKRAMSGFGLFPRPLAWMKRAAPDDYQKVLAVFPYAEAMVLRYELEQAEEAAHPKPKPERKRAAPGGSRADGKRAARARAANAQQVSEVRDAASAPQRAEERPVQPAQD
jgi:phosphoadenosine phosphosulfate reductase